MLLNVVEARLQGLMYFFIERRIAEDQGAFACIDARPVECGFEGVASSKADIRRRTLQSCSGTTGICNSINTLRRGRRH